MDFKDIKIQSQTLNLWIHLKNFVSKLSLKKLHAVRCAHCVQLRDYYTHSDCVTKTKATVSYCNG